MTARSIQLLHNIMNVNQRRLEAVQYFAEQYLRLHYVKPDPDCKGDNPDADIYDCLNPSDTDYPDFVIVQGDEVHLYLVQVLPREGPAFDREFPHGAVCRFTMTRDEFNMDVEDIVNRDHERSESYRLDWEMDQASRKALLAAQANRDRVMDTIIWRFLSENRAGLVEILKKYDVKL